MNAFQILDKDGNPLSINSLDGEVCQLMGVEQDVKWYCGLVSPNDYEGGEKSMKYMQDNMTANWFDTIGWMIAEGKTFQGILDYYTESMKEYIGQEDEKWCYNHS